MKNIIKTIQKVPAIIAILFFIALVIGYEWLVKIWSASEMSAVIRVDIIVVYPLLIALSIGLYWLLKKKKYIKSLLLLLAVVITAVIAFFYTSQQSQEKFEAFIKQQNSELTAQSDSLKKQLKDLPANIADKIVVMGNPKSNTVIINAQGGPMTTLENFEITMIMAMAKLKHDSAMLINVHQYQTLRTEAFESKLINFEDAKKYDAESVKYLADTVEYFKSKGYKVIVLGISFGAFVVEDLLARYDAVADKYIIVVGRLDMPDAVWQEFSKGNYVGFKYQDGAPKIVKFTADEAGMGGGNSIADKNTSIIAAGLGYKRFTTLLKDKDLSKVSYFFGTIDEQVGRLSANEIAFLKSKGVVPIELNKDHGGTIDEFSEKYLKKLLQ